MIHHEGPVRRAARRARVPLAGSALAPHLPARGFRSRTPSPSPPSGPTPSGMRMPSPHGLPSPHLPPKNASGSRGGGGAARRTPQPFQHELRPSFDDRPSAAQTAAGVHHAVPAVVPVPQYGSSAAQYQHTGGRFFNIRELLSCTAAATATTALVPNTAPARRGGHGRCWERDELLPASNSRIEYKLSLPRDELRPYSTRLTDLKCRQTLT